MKSKIVFLTLLCVCGAALAAAPTAEDIRHCSAIADSTARLACFDQLSAAPATTAKKGPVAAPVAPVVVAPAAAGSLGADSMHKSAEQRAAEATAPSALTAQVTAVLPTQGNMYRITLDNAQVWQTMEGRSVFVVKPGDTVHVEKRSMGNYQVAVVANGKESYSVQAKRLK